jgi:hypothetical protein
MSSPNARFTSAGLLFLFMAFCAVDAEAIPAWSRKYETSCSTCHAAYPKLNYFGKAFRNNGYRFPAGTEETATKETPVSLGSEGYKKLFPRALWPSTVASHVPLAVRGVLRANSFEDSNADSFEFPHEFELLGGGTLGETFSFFAELEVENEANENEVEMVAALQYDPLPGLHVRLGTIRAHPIADGQRLTAAHPNPYEVRTAPSSLTLKVPNPNHSTSTVSITATTGEDRWRFRDDHAGIEVWGAHNGPNGNGGLTWSLGLVNGQGLGDANNSKDVFARVAYKFGGYGELGGGESPQTTEFWRDDSFKVGLFGYKGKSTNTYEGSIDVLSGTPGSGITRVSASTDVENDFDILGVEIDWWFRDLNLTALYLQQSDDNPRGTGESIDTDAWFVEANYTALPWLIGVLRYGQTSQDFSVRPDPVDQEFLVPAVVVMARANVKFTLERQMRLDDPGKGHDRYVLSVDFAF